MKPFSVELDISWRPCQSLWQLRSKDRLPQEQRITDFIESHQVHDVKFVTPNDEMESHQMHVLTVNQPIDLDDLIKTVILAADHSERYIWVSINKFLVYNQTDRNFAMEIKDFDERLIRYVYSYLKQWQLLTFYVNSRDKGKLGNFQYPVTQMVCQRS